MNLKTSFVGLLLCAPVFSQGLMLLEGTSTANLDVRLLDEANLATGAGTTLLQGIEAMPIEITGRRASQEIDGTVSRVENRSGIARIELPGKGRIIAYRRQGGAFWGFLFAPLMGGGRVLLELPGIGGTSSPFADRIAVSPDGTYAVIPRFGGVALHIFRLDGGLLGNGSDTRIVSVPGGTDNTGVMVGATHIFATGNDRIVRIPLASGNAVDMTPPLVAANPRLKPELAMSGDGSMVVFLYGGTNQTLRLYLLDSTSNAAVTLPPAASKYEEPGYLPEGTGDLRLMLNADGSRLFYVENGVSGTGHGGDESWLLDTTGALPAMQITSDQHFQPWIGIHILPAFKGQQVVAAIGDLNQMDWYAAQLSPTGGSVVNLTATGPVTQPFDVGALVPTQIKVVGEKAFAIDAPTAAASTMRAIDLATNNAQVLFQDLPTSLAVGSSMWTTPDLYVPGAADRLYSGLTGNLIGATPPGLSISPPLSTPWFGATALKIAPFGLITFYLPTGEVLFGPAVPNLEQMMLTPNFGMLVSSPTELFYMSIGRPNVVVPIAHRGVRVFLTGAIG